MQLVVVTTFLPTASNTKVAEMVCVVLRSSHGKATT